MVSDLVPSDFAVPLRFECPAFQLEPLGPQHNDRDHDAWMSSIDHIRATPGFDDWKWPEPMSLEANLADLEMHARDFESRKGFTYSVLDGEDVIGCVYIYPSKDPDYEASVRSWVRADRAHLDRIVWSNLSDWLSTVWPFTSIRYAARR